MDRQITDSKHRRLFSVLTSAARQKILCFWSKNATLTTLIQVFSIRIWTPTRSILDQCCRLHCYWSPRSDQPVFVILSSQLTIYLCMLCTGRHLDPALSCCGRQKGRRQDGKYPHFKKKSWSVFIFNFFSLFSIVTDSSTYSVSLWN